MDGPDEINNDSHRGRQVEKELNEYRKKDN